MKKYFLLGALFIGIFLIAPAVHSQSAVLIPTNPTFSVSVSPDGVNNWTNSSMYVDGGFSSYSIRTTNS